MEAQRSEPQAVMTRQAAASAFDEAAAVAETIRRVSEVVGNGMETMRWLGTPVRALDYATPVSQIIYA